MSSREELFTRIREIIHKEFDVAEDRIQMETKLEDITKDSIQLFELVLVFEQAFKLEASYEDLIRIKSIGDIVDYLSNHFSSKKGARLLPPSATASR